MALSVINRIAQKLNRQREIGLRISFVLCCFLASVYFGYTSFSALVFSRLFKQTAKLNGLADRSQFLISVASPCFHDQIMPVLNQRCVHVTRSFYKVYNVLQVPAAPFSYTWLVTTTNQYQFLISVASL